MAKKKKKKRDDGLPSDKEMFELTGERFILGKCKFKYNNKTIILTKRQALQLLKEK